MNFNIIKKLQYDTNCRDCQARGTTLFKLIPDEYLDGAQSHRKEQLEIPARTRIFQEGETHNNVYSVFSGWGLIYKTVSNNGKRQVLRFLLPGDLVGFQTDAKGAMTYSAGTVTETILCSFPRDKMRPMLLQNPEIAVRFGDMESRDVSLCQNHLMAAGRKTAKESIAFVLLELLHRVKYQMPDSYDESSNSIDFPVTQEDIGDAIGLTNIHVNRVMKELMRENLIHCHKRKLTIINEQKLSEIADFNTNMVINP